MLAIAYMLLGAVLCWAGIVSCSWRRAEYTNSQAPAGFTQHMGQNRRVVVLPFDGDGDNPQLATRVRQSFFSHFSPKKYYDVEPRDIDAMLDTLDALSGRQWSCLSPIELGRCFKADYLIYGRVLSTRRLFFIFYSQIAINVEIRLVETRRGRTVWKTAAEKRIQSGDMPLHPLSLVSAAVHTRDDASDERMQDLIERTCRELAQSVPEPADENKNFFRADIQVASFSSGQRAQRMAGELQGKGYERRVERVSINGADWHRVLVGPSGRADAETARHQLAAEPAARPVLIYAR
jgi:cell division septation protein DedD